jgi:acyl-CoA thioesterase FadM
VRGKVTVVCIEMKSFRSQPIPDFYRRLFESHLA